MFKDLRGARAALTGALACAALGVGHAAPASASGCAGADVAPGAADLSVAQAATLCLLNEERTSRGLVALTPSASLEAAAVEHTTDMVAHGYFAHDALDGTDFGTRVERSGYLSGRATWMLGENLAWGSGSRSTPEEVMAGWLASAAHRANILTPEFRDIGISVVAGAPVQTDLPGATYGNEFGLRSAPAAAARPAIAKRVSGTPARATAARRSAAHRAKARRVAQRRAKAARRTSAARRQPQRVSGR